MALPSLENLSALDLLRLADNPTENVKNFMVARLVENKSRDRHLLLDEFLWVYKIAVTGSVLKKILEELPCDEAIHRLAQGLTVEKDAGPRPNLVYEMAEHYESVTKKKPTTIFQELVWPALIELGIIKPDELGMIDPELKRTAKNNYFSARQRRKSPKKKEST